MGKYKTYKECKDSGFEWLGEVPKGWGLYSGKRIFKNRKLAGREGDQQLAASQRYGVIPQELMMKLDGAKVMLALKGTSSFRHVEIDDFVISLRSFEGGIEHSKYVGCVSPAYTVLQPSKKVFAGFFRYLFKSKPFIAALQSTTDSLRDGKSITFDQFSLINLILPEVDEQFKIANFLNHETAKIDTLIEKQKKLIELLKEKRQAVISHAVTKGLDPDATMKDSRVEWLGEVPEHWDVVRLKYLSETSVSGPYGSSLTKAMYTNNGIRVYGQQQVILDDFELGDYYISHDKFEEMKRYEVFPNELLVTVMGTIGRASIVPQEVEKGIINPRLVKYKINEMKIIPNYLKAVIMADISQKLLSLEAQGSTMEGLNMQIIGGLPIMNPPIKEQKIILKYIDGISNKFKILIEKANLEVELLKERRTSLISAAVTGKVDVRDWQKPT